MLLDPAVAKIRTVRAANPDRDRKKPCVYVGMMEQDLAEDLRRAGYTVTGGH